MFSPLESTWVRVGRGCRRRVLPGALTLPLLAWVLLAGLMLAFPALGQPSAADPEAAETLLEGLEDRFDILTLSDRWVLQPKDSAASFSTVEIQAGSVMVDNETLSSEQLRERLGDAADTISALADLGSTEGTAAEELRRRIERMAEERRLQAEEIEELVRSRFEELENREQERLEENEERLEENEERSEEERRGPSIRRRGTERTDTQVSFGSSLTIEADETSRDVVVIGGSLDVEGRVRGDAVVIGGSAEVRGEVDGSVTAIGGPISLGPGARIDGDATSIGGAVHQDSTARIDGEITEVSLVPGFDFDDMWDGLWVPRFVWFDFGVGELVARIGKSVTLAIVLLLLVLLLPRLVSATAGRARSEPWKAGIVGLGSQLLFLFALPVVIIILLITIVGIPLALLLAPLATFALLVLFVLGFAGIAMAGGELLEERFGWRVVNPYLLVLLGLGLIQGWSILGEFLGFLGGPISLFAWLILLLGFLIKYVAWTTGLGAILLHFLSPLPTSPRPAIPLPPSGPTPAPSSRREDSPLPPVPPPTPEVWQDSGPTPEARQDSGDEPEPEVVDPDEEYLQAGVQPSAAPTDPAESSADSDAEAESASDQGRSTTDETDDRR